MNFPENYREDPNTININTNTQQTQEVSQEFDYPQLKQRAKKVYSSIGITLFLSLMIASTLQGILVGIGIILHPSLMDDNISIAILSFIPLYFVAIPFCIYRLMRLPKASLPKASLEINPLSFMIIFTICIFFMYFGSMISSVLMITFSTILGRDILNPVSELLMDSSIWINIGIISIIAPFVEEFIFRKLLIDRMYIYGEYTAILLSALLFGLFHANLFQFFYAFLLGLVFGYIYLRTGKLRYTIVLHMIINFMGSVVGTFILQNAETNIVTPLKNGDIFHLSTANMIGITIHIIYLLTIFTLFIIGLIMIIRYRKEIYFLPTNNEIKKEDTFSVAYKNLGILLMISGCIILMILSIFATV